MSPPVPPPKERGGERKATPPSSSRGPVGGRDPGENTNASDDDGKNKDPENPNQGRGDGSRAGGGTRSKAARGSWQELADDIVALPEEELTEEARVLAEKLREKVPRVAVARLERLALRAIQTGNVEHLGAVVASIETKLRYEVDNAWSYLVKALHPLPAYGGRDGESRDAREGFAAAYGAAQPRRTLRGAGRRHQFEPAPNTQPRETDSYFTPFITDDERDQDAAGAFNDAYEDARPARTLGGKASRDGFAGIGGRRPPTEDYIERL